MDVTPNTRSAAGPEAAGTPAAAIALEGIGKRYPDGTEAVRELSLRVPAG
ncbi:ABC transporter ATP-binding protein, partial [Micromonospora sp. DH15]|nr:ABC transporter ATP-binding protein [Micromonospora sp. DH15]